MKEKLPENKAFEAIKSRLARSLKEALLRETVLPPEEKPMECELHIPYHQLQPHEEELDTATARVTYIVECPTEKKHTVTIKFKYDKNGRFLRETMEYI